MYSLAEIQALMNGGFDQSIGGWSPEDFNKRAVGVYGQAVTNPEEGQQAHGPLTLEQIQLGQDHTFAIRNPGGSIRFQHYTPENGGFVLGREKTFDNEQAYRQFLIDQQKPTTFEKAVPLIIGAMAGYGALQGLGVLGGEAGGGLLGSGAIEGAAGVTEGLGASMAANGAAVANSTLAALPQAGFTIGEGLAAGAAGGAAASGGFGQLAGSSVGEAFGATAPEMGSGLLGQSGALAQGAAGTGYVSPFATGSITGVSGMAPITSAGLADIAATTGLNTTGLAAGAGVSAGLLEGATPLEPKSLLEKAIDAAKNDPYKTLKTIQSGAQVLDSLTNKGGSGSSYKAGPIDQSIVDKFKNPTALAPIRRQQFQSLALPQGLLDTRLSLLGG